MSIFPTHYGCVGNHLRDESILISQYQALVAVADADLLDGFLRTSEPDFFTLHVENKLTDESASLGTSNDLEELRKTVYTCSE